jgi:predicted Zn finger-like uncharacterized protein
MSIALQCEQCGTRYALRDELAGKAVKCKACGRVLRVPVPPPSSPRRRRRRSSRSTAAAMSSNTPSGLDLYGLDELAAASDPEPQPRDDSSPDEPAPALDPPRRRPKRSRSRSDSDSDSRSGARSSVAVVVFLVLLVARIYFRVSRKLQDRPEAAVPAPAGAAVEPGPAAAPAARPAVALSPPLFPELGDGVPLERGVRFYEVRLGPPDPAPASPGHRGKLWLYLPVGQNDAGSLPCILIAGAGSNLVSGMDLAAGDRPEHLPYVRAGFAVLAYELDGALQDRDGGSDLARGAAAFLAAQAGLVNARNALDFLASRVPEVDPERIYAVGHSSAATLALLVAENEPRIKGCVAFAPVVDTAQRTPRLAQQRLARFVPGAGDFFTRYNPRQHEDAIHCPVFLFHAEDDSNVPVGESLGCQARLEALGKAVTLETVPTGDHYQGMLAQGIPRAIAWLKRLPATRDR